MIVIVYMLAGYWYFWRVLLLESSSTRGEIAVSAIAGLLFGPVLLAGALVFRGVTDVCDLIRRSN